MPETNYIPPEVAEQGIKAVHPYPFCAGEDSHILRRFNSEYAYATFPKLELQPPHAYASIILDCDSDSIERLEAPGKAWWGGTPAPVPSCAGQPMGLPGSSSWLPGVARRSAQFTLR